MANEEKMTVAEFDALKKSVRRGYTPPQPMPKPMPESPKLTGKQREEFRKTNGPGSVPDFMVQYIKDYMISQEQNDMLNDTLKDYTDYEIKKLIWREWLDTGNRRKYTICG